MTKIFPILLVIVQLGAALVYLAKGDIRHFIYWLAACVLTIAVSF